MQHFEALGQVRKNGAGWSTETEDLDATLVHWNPEKSVEKHVNSYVDVVMTVIFGSGVIIVDGVSLPVVAGYIVVIPKGAEREIVAGPSGMTYLNVHKRRHKLMPNMQRPQIE